MSSSPNCKSPEHRAWQRIKRRCLDPKHHAYKNYGAKGITVHPEWVSSFSAFFAEIGSRPSDKHSVDRIDTTRGYEPGNVRWATHDVQQNNRTNNFRIIYRGKEMTVTQAWRASGEICCRWGIAKRIKAGWPVNEAVETPPFGKRPISATGGAK